MTPMVNVNSHLFLFCTINSTATKSLLHPLYLNRLNQLVFLGCRKVWYSQVSVITSAAKQFVVLYCYKRMHLVARASKEVGGKHQFRMAGIPESVRARYKANFEADPKNRLARNVCTKFSPEDILRTRVSDETACHVFSHKVEGEGKPITNQKSSGRCWIFAALNCMRIPLMKRLKLEELQLSQNYLFFFDKLERSNYQLQVFVETARNQEPADGRLVQHLLSTPSSEDGGQWDMLVGLIEKYGVMPQDCFPDTWTSLSSRKLGAMMNTKMREFCMRLRHLVEKGVDDDAIRKEKETMMEEIYRIVSICLGTPPDTFTYEYYDKDKEYHKIGPIKPVDFYKQYVKPLFNMEDKVVVGNDPRADNPFNKLYSVQYLSNMENGLVQKYVNQPIEVLKKLAAESIKKNEPVWFGSDVEQFLSKGKGLLDLTQHDHDLVFGTSLLKQSKADRLLYKESLMSHAMVLTAVTEEDGKTLKWRVENSWGEEHGVKGYLVMTDDWFTEFVFEVVVDRKFVPAEILDMFKQEPKVLPAWDPMGTLAKRALQIEK